MDNPVGAFLIIMGCSMVCFVIGLACGNSGPSREQEAIEKGYARYNPKTGNWEWIEPTECGQIK